MLFSIHLLDVAHKSGKGFGIGIARGVAEGAQGLDRANDGNGFTFVDLNSRKSRVVLLDPDRRVTRSAIFPTAKPENDEAQIVLSRFGDDSIELGVVEFALFRRSE